MRLQLDKFAALSFIIEMKIWEKLTGTIMKSVAIKSSIKVFYPLSANVDISMIHESLKCFW